jgi:hypothetical protein
MKVAQVLGAVLGIVSSVVTAVVLLWLFLFRPGSAGLVTLLLLMLGLGVLGIWFTWGPHSQSWHRSKKIAGGAAASLAVLAVVGSLLAITPDNRADEAISRPTNLPVSNTSTSKPSESPSDFPTPSPSPTLTSAGRKLVKQDGSVTLQANSTSVLKAAGFRVALSSLYDNYGDVRIVADDAGTCQGYLDVGDSIALTNRRLGEADYSRWYYVIVDRIDARGLTLTWATGTGLAPEPNNTDCT